MDTEHKKLAEELQRLSQIEYRVVILGHLQRGGQPTAKDRVLATKLGAHAVEMFLQGAGQIMVGEVGGQLCTTPMSRRGRSGRNSIRSC